MNFTQEFDYTGEPLVEYEKYLVVGLEYIPEDIYILKQYLMHEDGYIEEELSTDTDVLQALKDNETYKIIEVNSCHEDNYKEINESLADFFNIEVKSIKKQIA
ncbi:hypothetical protein [Apilactobacillus xinyiensis]|uniref:hypothetical protein n=1 Tax=Apilactobacillus xinyiensis TaxID=2841032 RepID=UPI001C7CE1E3|nr:hypothetical protein [Apilactobacillus xinyiensis]